MVGHGRLIVEGERGVCGVGVKSSISQRFHKPQSGEMKELKERNKAIRGLRKEGLTYSSIGYLFSHHGVPLSRQRIHQICQKKRAGFWRGVWFWLRALILN